MGVSTTKPCSTDITLRKGHLQSLTGFKLKLSVSLLGDDDIRNLKQSSDGVGDEKVSFPRTEDHSWRDQARSNRTTGIAFKWKMRRRIIEQRTFHPIMIDVSSSFPCSQIFSSSSILQHEARAFTAKVLARHKTWRGSSSDLIISYSWVILITKIRAFLAF